MFIKQQYATVLVTFVIVLFFIQCNDPSTGKLATLSPTEAYNKSEGLFVKISEETSGITFSNTLKEDLSTYQNLFDFDYFYNGAGVGIEDINNDGLLDVFFAGNQTPNKLYLNLGDFKFQDISETAGINKNKVWANGVTFVDINADGYMDIYVSQGGPYRANERKNLLYLNNKDNTFTEQAEILGLADPGISTQSVFFDYDKDGDLDCFVSNENELFGMDPTTFFGELENNDALKWQSSGHLYQNNNGKFKDVTIAAGLVSASFGLGVTVSDVNDDGWLDIYVANDYYVADALFVNQQDGTFKNTIKEQTNQVSFYGMGVDIADINNDKLQDIFVLDMASSDHIRAKTLMASMDVDRFTMLTDKLGMQHQYMYNSLQLNTGNNTFNNIAQYAKVSKTDWSWAGLLADFDLDGLKDIYVTNGYRKYALDNDSQNQIRQVQQAYRGNVPLEIKEKLYDALPSEKLSNILYRNTKDLKFIDETSYYGLEVPSFSNGAAYADLDNDGDLDLIVNNIDEPAFVFKNNAIEKNLGNYLTVKTKGAISENFAKVSIAYNGITQLQEIKRVRGYLSSCEATAYFGVGTATKIDTLLVQFPSGKSIERYNVAVNNTITINEEDGALKQFNKAQKSMFAAVPDNAGINFAHKENEYVDFKKEILLPYKQSTLGPGLAVGDVNGDGLEDVYIGGAAGQPGVLYLQQNDGFVAQKISAFEIDKAHEDMDALFFDANGNSNLDLFVTSGGNEFEEGDIRYADRLYINDGNGNFTKLNDPTLNSLLYSGKTVAAIDFDKDGDLDLAIGNRIVPQRYPEVAPSYLLENDNGKWNQVAADRTKMLSNKGIINKIITTDFDNDGWDDLIAVGEWTGVRLLKNEQGTFVDVSESTGLDRRKGLWFSIQEIDLNGDALPDYIVGNIGENVKYKATDKVPFEIYGNDFDDNGTYDIVLSTQYNGVAVPARGRECSSQQMPFITEKFETYNAFANASLRDIYGDKLDSATYGSINTLSSIALVNNGNGGFEIVALPYEAQLFPILSVAVKDIDNDGDQDAILAGNMYDTEAETPRLDGGKGLVLLNEDNLLISKNYTTTGLYINGNTKDVAFINTASTKNPLLISVQNNTAVQIFKLDY